MRELVPGERVVWDFTDGYLGFIADKKEWIGTSARFDISAKDGGTEVWMLFAGERDGKPLFDVPEPAAPDDGWSKQLTGDAVVSVSPIELLGGVLGRISRALAATARFSLDRFSDVYLVTDAISAHASTASMSNRIAFAITAGGRQMSLVVGPLKEGSGIALDTQSREDGSRSPLHVLTDELELIRAGGSEMLQVVMIDHRE